MKVFSENLYSDHGQTLTLTALLYKGRTALQDVMVFQNPTFGRVLVLDDVVQLTELDCHIYHEMMAHVPLMVHSGPKDVLIIGGGDGGVLREALKHPIETATLVEIDREVIEISRAYFPNVCGPAFDDSRATLIIEDGADYLDQVVHKFDVIIIDSTDPIGPAKRLFGEGFYRKCRTALRPGGVICIQSGVPFYSPLQLKRKLRKLRHLFGKAAPFMAPVPTYANGMLALILSGDVPAFRPPATLLGDRWSRLNGRTRFYSTDVHRGAFAMTPVFGLDSSNTRIQHGREPRREIATPSSQESCDPTASLPLNRRRLDHAVCGD